jgi:hypothetical protein
MSTDFEREVSAALHRAADQLPLRGLDLGVIRQRGRRRQRLALIAAPLASAVMAAAVVIGVLQLPGLLTPSYPSNWAPVGPANANHSPAGGPAVTNVQAFFAGYVAAGQRGQAALDAFIRGHVASWYAPLLEAGPQTGGPPDCFPEAALADYATAGQVGGQAIIVVSSANGPGQALYGVVTADPGTGMITGIACPAGGGQVTAAGARDATSALYVSWLTFRRQGESVPEAVAHILGTGAYARSGGGPESGSPYLKQLQEAAPWQELTYDPLLCTSAGLPDVSVSSTSVVAGGSAGVVALTPAAGEPIVAVVVQGAKGWAVADVACDQP